MNSTELRNIEQYRIIHDLYYSDVLYKDVL